MTLKKYTNKNANLKIDPNEPGLIAGWEMKPYGNQIIDISGNGNNGTIIGQTIHGKTQLGDYTKATENGSGINSTNSSVFQISSGTITFEFLMHFSSVVGDKAVITKGNAFSDQNYYLRTQNKKIIFYFRDSTNTVNVTYQSDNDLFEANLNYHIVFTHTFGDANSTKIWH